MKMRITPTIQARFGSLEYLMASMAKPGIKGKYCNKVALPGFSSVIPLYKIKTLQYKIGLLVKKSWTK